MNRKRGSRVTRFPKRRQRKGDGYEDGPAAVIPFAPPAPRTPAEPATSAQVFGGRLTKRRTLTPGLTMTLSLNVDELARALVAAEEKRRQQSGTKRRRRRVRH